MAFGQSRAERKTMSARVVLIQDQPEVRGKVSGALTDASFDVAVFPDSLGAPDTLAAAEPVELLITRVQFAAGQSNGPALALITRNKRPEVKVLFVCKQEYKQDVKDLGEFLAASAAIPEVVAAASRLLRSSDGSDDTCRRLTDP
jgi:DNA-binding NtrC family response regulator